MDRASLSSPRPQKPCPGCSGQLSLVWGPLRGPYWRHVGDGSGCRFEPKPMTEWHLLWQALCADRPSWEVEAIREHGGELHVADAVAPCGLVLEFQHSAISGSEVEARNEAHFPLVWVVDATQAATAGNVACEESILRWKSAPNWLPQMLRAVPSWVLIDDGERIMRATGVSFDGPWLRTSVRLLTSRNYDSGEPADSFRRRLLRVLDMADPRWEPMDLVDWVLVRPEVESTELLRRGVTPDHAQVWLKGVGTLDVLVEIHHRADNEGWVFDASVFEEHQGKMIQEYASGARDLLRVDEWIDTLFSHHSLVEAGVGKGPANEWSKYGKDWLWVLLEAKQLLEEIGASIDVLWRQHRRRDGGDTAYAELKRIVLGARWRDPRISDREALDAWWERWKRRWPYSTEEFVR